MIASSLSLTRLQDPILFSGTIRSNLDPFHKHSDNDILAALLQVQLVHNQSENTVEMTDNLRCLDVDTPAAWECRRACPPFTRARLLLLKVVRALIESRGGLCARPFVPKGLDVAGTGNESELRLRLGADVLAWIPFMRLVTSSVTSV